MARARVRSSSSVAAKKTHNHASSLAYNQRQHVQQPSIAASNIATANKSVVVNKKAAWREKAKAKLASLAAKTKVVQEVKKVVQQAQAQVEVVRKAEEDVRVAVRAQVGIGRTVADKKSKTQTKASAALKAVTSRLGRTLYKNAFKPVAPRAGAASASSNGGASGGGPRGYDEHVKAIGEFQQTFTSLSRALDAEQKIDYQWIDARNKLRQEIRTLFSMVHKACTTNNVDEVMREITETRELIAECEQLYAEDASDDDESDEQDIIIKSRLEAAAATALLDAHELAVDLQKLTDMVDKFNMTSEGLPGGCVLPGVHEEANGHAVLASKRPQEGSNGGVGEVQQKQATKKKKMGAPAAPPAGAASAAAAAAEAAATAAPLPSMSVSASLTFDAPMPDDIVDDAVAVLVSTAAAAHLALDDGLI